MRSMISSRRWGCSSLRKTASVVLMMPAPTRTMSASVTASLSLMRFPSKALFGRFEWHGHAVSQHDIDSPPRLIVHQFPGMAAARGILGQQDLARPDREVLAAARLEVERARQGDDELAHRRGVPGQRAARLGFLEGRLRRRQLVAQKVTVGAGFELDPTLLGMNSGLRRSKSARIGSLRHPHILQKPVWTTVVWACSTGKKRGPYLHWPRERRPRTTRSGKPACWPSSPASPMRWASSPSMPSPAR